MSQRLDALLVREYTDRNGEKKAAFTKIGTAFQSKDGRGYSLIFEALPLPTMGQDGKVECRVLLREPRPQEEQQGGGRQAQSPRASQSSQGGGFGDDDIPF